MELIDEINKEYRSGSTWYSQIKNIGYSIGSATEKWAYFMVLLVGLQCIAFMLLPTWTPETADEMREAFNLIAVISSVISIFLVIFSDKAHRLKNVFRAEAENRVDQNRTARQTLASQIETTDSLLYSYGLITKVDIERRRNRAAKTK